MGNGHVLRIPGNGVQPFAAIHAMESPHVLHLHIAGTVGVLNLGGIAVWVLILKAMAQQRIQIACRAGCPHGHRAVSVMLLHEAAGDAGEITGGLGLVVNILQHIHIGSVGGVVQERGNQLSLHIHKF